MIREEDFLYGGFNGNSEFPRKEEIKKDKDIRMIVVYDEIATYDKNEPLDKAKKGILYLWEDGVIDYASKSFNLKKEGYTVCYKIIDYVKVNATNFEISKIKRFK